MRENKKNSLQVEKQNFGENGHFQGRLNLKDSFPRRKFPKNLWVQKKVIF